MSQTEQILSQLPGNPLAGLRRADRLWESLKKNTAPVPTVVKETHLPLGKLEWDVVVCGGTLGILIACVLQGKGLRVALIERGILRGREQEWNISRHELSALLELELLTEVELERAIATTYNPARIAFYGGVEVWVRDILNLGVDPVFLLETLKNKFLARGGQLLENTPFENAIVHPDGVSIEAGDKRLNARLLIDAMGHFSPIGRQARKGHKPDGICLVVGTCATGYPQNETGDLFVSCTPLANQCQYFWEAFPARDGRTTYLFTYLDAHPNRFSLEFFFDEYLRLLPTYQNITLEQLEFKRALFGFFPCYQQSPLKTPFHRILPAGDSSGSQSPLSFGGFGATIRHLKRLTTGIYHALQIDALDRQNLAILQPYQPNLSVTWLFQKSMSVGVDRPIPSDRINTLLSDIFAIMSELGEDVLRPFLQDVVQFGGLSKTLAIATLRHPLLIAKLIPQVGLIPLLDWTVHYLNLGAYTTLYPLGRLIEPWTKNLSPTQQYYTHRLIEAWQYGSGSDFNSK